MASHKLRITVNLKPVNGDWLSNLSPASSLAMNADSKQPIILLREVEPGEWWMEMPRITCEVDERLQAGIDFMHAGNFNQAIAKFARLINELPEHLDAYHHLALTLQYAGRNHEATDVWRCAVELALQFFPERFDFSSHQLPWLELGNRPFLRAYHGLGLCVLDDGDVEAALEIFERLVSLNPNDNLGARALVVGCRLALHQPEGVLKVCRQYPEDGMEQLVYGRPLALFQLGRLKPASQALKQAINLLPLIAKELVKKSHRRPKGVDPRYVTMGGADQAYDYWQDHGKHWQNTPGALDWLKGYLKDQPKQAG